VAKPASVIVDTRLCTACRACEVACHYHHSGSFGTSRSSIEIQYNADISQISIAFNHTCDACPAESEPLCIHFCVPGAIVLQV
jgi:Fe-S-cluster-containing dehydrogenase component